MTKFVDEIVNDIRNNPKSWSSSADTKILGKYDGIARGNVKVVGFGLSKMFSIISVYINNKGVPTLTWRDKWRLESCVIFWYKQCTVDELINDPIQTSYQLEK